MIAELATGLSKIDVGWCREVDDFALAKIQDECDNLKDLSCWGCNRVTPAARRRPDIRITGIEMVFVA